MQRETAEQDLSAFWEDFFERAAGVSVLPLGVGLDASTRRLMERLDVAAAKLEDDKAGAVSRALIAFLEFCRSAHASGIETDGAKRLMVTLLGSMSDHFAGCEAPLMAIPKRGGRPKLSSFEFQWRVIVAAAVEELLELGLTRDLAIDFVGRQVSDGQPSRSELKRVKAALRWAGEASSADVVDQVDAWRRVLSKRKTADRRDWIGQCLQAKFSDLKLHTG